MNQQTSPDVQSQFPPNSFLPDQNFGVSQQELLRRQLNYTAAMEAVKERVRAGLTFCVLAMPGVAMCASIVVDKVCEEPNVPAVVCETNQEFRAGVNNILRHFIDIPEPDQLPSRYDEWMQQ